jgi:5'-AMP-activated protein kinase, regulatory gamma subunit
VLYWHLLLLLLLCLPAPFALLDMQAAPLWDPTFCQFVGLLTVTDFIDILRHYRRTNADVSTLATRSIADILNDPIIKETVLSRQEGFCGADSSTTLKHACRQLHECNLDFLPILMPEDMRVLACITYTNILEHLVTHFREQRRLFDDTIHDLRIGTYHGDLIKVAPQQTLAEALELMHQHRLSALPVVEQATEKIVGVYSRSDITFLTRATDAEDAVSNLDMTLGDVLGQQRTDVTTPDALHTCKMGDTLQSIFEYFAQIRFNRLFVTDAEEHVVGVVSARDLVAYFLNENT